MNYLIPLLLVYGCAQPFDHTQSVTLGPDPFIVDGSCAPKPLTTVVHDDGSITTTQTEALGQSCRFSGSWRGPVLDLEGDVQSRIGSGASFVALFWQDAQIDVTSADYRRDGGEWVDIRTQAIPGLSVTATSTLSAGPPLPGPAAVQITVPAAPGEPVQALNEGQLLAAVEDGWYGQDPRRAVMGFAEGTVEIGDATLDA